MASEKFDFAEFLAVLEAKRAALDALIGSYRAALSIGALGQPGDIDVSGIASTPTLAAGKPVDLPQGALLGMSIPAAIKLYLSAARRKQTTREITAGLKEGGVESTSRFFENTVSTALHRLKAAGDVLKFNDGWALAELYPESFRSRISAQQGEARAAVKVARDAKPARRGRKKTSRARTSAPAPRGPSIDDRVLAHIQATGPSLSKDVAAVFKTDPKLVAMAFTRLIGRKKLVKGEDGRYSVTHKAQPELLRAV